MEPIEKWIQAAADLLWGWPLMALLAGTGLWLTLLLRGVQFRRLLPALAMAFLPGREGRPRAAAPPGGGDISNFQALMTALSATVGTGNIAGVATAVAAGGPGSLFWLFCMGLVGMATKYAEAVLAVEYRVQGAGGATRGGPMYYLERGLGWKWAGRLFAFFTATAALLGIGNMVQSNSIAEACEASLGTPRWIVGVVVAVATLAVLAGGVKSIGKVAAVLVPGMILLYLGGAILVLVLRADAIPAALRAILDGAFSPTAATGAFAGAGVREAMRMGIARGLFSNEAGLGSAPIAAAAARTNHPVEQALVSMTQTFIDTCLICMLTGLALLVTGAWISGATGAPLTAAAFASVFPGGGYVVTFSLVLFAWSTILGWAYYGETALEYLAGTKVIPAYRVLFGLVAGAGTLLQAGAVWALGDACNALMALPNLAALLLLSPVVARLTREWEAKERERPTDLPPPRPAA
ncbi:MAG: sodium:alanine symporter family protein [Planctomycetaceae bacterium]|nr:amino acid carrier protein [Planctomycetota bacterium]NUN52965.1 sodium:alanine symporter family protein [Planctomycetaceae bacterium]